MSAVISDDRKYRYLLSRPPVSKYPDKGTALFIMLNPSTADAELDDPTIRRCRGFAEHWGCNGIVVANLYALRATNPKELWSSDDPVGGLNDMYLRNLAKEYETVVFAFGGNAKLDRVKQVYEIFKNRYILCLGVTKDGMPKHPLYLKGDTPLIPWSAP
jgi:hypothetical protein